MTNSVQSGDTTPMLYGVPDGFVPLYDGGEFIDRNGPLFISSCGRDVRIGFRVEARLTNPFQTCHGGMLASFCDMLLPWLAQRSVEDLGNRYLPSISLQIDFLAPARLGTWVEGRAEVLRYTRHLVFAQGLVYADGEPVVRVSGLFKVGNVFSEPPAFPQRNSDGTTCSP